MMRLTATTQRLFARTCVVALIGSLVISFVPPPAPVKANTLASPTSKSASFGSWVNVGGSGTLAVSGMTGNVQVIVTGTSGTVRLSSVPTGITAPTGYSSADWTGGTKAEIAFVGTQTDVNNALNVLQFSASQRSPQPAVSVVAFQLGSGSISYWSGNKHFYEVVSGTTISWPASRCKAKWASRTYGSGTSTVSTDQCTGSGDRRKLNNLTGYLANITSLDEHLFLREKMSGIGWIGGADTDTEGSFRWMDGPEANQIFFNSVSTRRTTNTIDGRSMFNYFSDGEPNDSGGNEDFAEFGFGGSGVGSSWNDCGSSCSRSSYIIEYGLDGEVATGANANITMVLPPVAPTGVSASAGSSQATVSWSAVTDTGGAAVSYTATSSPGGFTCTTSSTSCNVTGLTPGTSYTFTVTANNGTHISSASSASSAVTPYTLPGAPTGLTATPGVGSVSLSFTAGSTGFTTITNYKYSFDGTSFTALAPADGTSPITISGLTNNTSYTVTLRAVNAAGDSSSSSSVSFRVDSTAPSVTATAQAVNSAGTITAQSNETGTLYLVNQSVTVSNLASITSAADNLWNSAAVTTANTNVSIAASGLTDGNYKVYATDGNSNVSSASSATMTIDSVAPSVTIAVSPSAVTSSTGQTATVTFTLNESVTTFDANDVTVTFGTLSNFTGSGSSYSATFTPSRSSGGISTITVAAGSISDAAGNTNSLRTGTITINATNGRTTYTANGSNGTDGTNYIAERFTTTGGSSWVAPRGVTAVDVLVVGGGGGGGSRHGGGGGAGGMLEATGYSVTQGSTYAITVGAGGAGAPGSTGGAGSAGESSSFSLGSSSIVANGGGPGSSGNAGGSTGGAQSAWNPADGTPGSVNGVTVANGATVSGVTGYGNAGGRGTQGTCGDGDDWCGGGGGGAGGTGSAAGTSVGGTGGAGGSGRASVIAGSSVMYAGGGGGASGDSQDACGASTGGTGGAGGSGIGGAGGSKTGSTPTAGGNGTANTGSGGGGGGYCDSGFTTTYGQADGGSGGSGIVIVRYTLPEVTTPDLDDASDTGSSTTDNKTSDTTPTFSGSAPVGSTVQLYANGVATGSPCITSDTTGLWQCTTAVLSSGVNSITAVSTTILESTTVTSTSSSLPVTINTYTVTYDSQGGTSIDPMSWTGGTSLTLPTPTRAGYTFAGWSTTASGSTKVYETTNPSRTSQLGSIVYTSGFGLGASDKAQQLINAGTSFNRVRYRMEASYNGTPRFADVSFDKWSGATIQSLSVPDFSSVGNQRVVKTNVSNLSVQSNWTAVPGVASAVTTGTSKLGRVELWNRNYGAATTGISPAGNGSTYDFDDTPSSDGSYGSFQVHNLTDSQTVLAWNNHSPTVSADIGFGNHSGTHPDWTFVGKTLFDLNTWKLQIFIGDLLTGGSSYSPSDTDDFTLYAQWDVVPYTVTYNGNSNTSGSAPTDASTYTYNDTVTTLGNTGSLARTGHTFSGWCTTQPAVGSPCTGTSYSSGSTFTITGNTTLYAVWLDITAPSVTAFTSATSGLTKNSSISYTITFSEAVTDVSSADFSNTGTATGCSFNPGTDTSGTTRTVTLTGCSDGTIIPRFAANGASDTSANTGPTSAATATTSITLDTTAPNVVSFSSTSSSPTAATTLTYTITFSEAVTGIAGTDFANTGTATGCSFNPGTDTSGTTRTVTITSCGNGTVIPRFIANGAIDTATNTGPAANSVSDSTIVRDDVVPVLSTATVNAAGTQITLTYNEALSTTTAATSAFDVRNAGVPNPVSSITVSGSTIILLLTETVYRAQTVTVTYTDPAGDTASTIQDLAGNDAASLTSQSVTNTLTTADVPRAARLIGLTSGGVRTETVVTVSGVSGGIRGMTSDGTYIYFRSSTDYSKIYQIPISSISTSEPTTSAAATSWSILDSAGVAITSASYAYEPTALAYSSGCIFVLQSTETDSSLRCIDVVTKRVSPITVPAGKSLPTGQGWLVGSLVSFPDGRIGKVSAPVLTSGAYISTLRLYTVNGTGGSATLTWSEDMLLRDTQAFPSDDHGIATDGKYIYRIRHQGGYKVWRLQSGSQSNIIFNGDGTGTCGGSGTQCSITPTGIGNATYIGYDASSNRYFVGDFAANKFYVTESQNPGAGPGTGSVVVDGFATSETSPTNNTAADYTITFSEAVTGVTGGDFSNSGTATCTFSVSSSSDSVYTATANCTTDGTIRPVFAANGATAVSNSSVTGPKFASASGTTLTLDTVAPTVTSFSSSASNGSYRAGQTIIISATMSESVRSGGDIVATLDTGATVTLTAATAGTSLTGTYTIAADENSTDLTVTGFTTGTVRDIAGNALEDTSVPTGANNIAGAKAIVVDTTAPTILSFTSTQSSPTNATSFTYTIEFSEAVSGIANTDFSNPTGATGCTFTPSAASGTTLTVTIASCSAGAVTPRFAVGGATDAAGNAGPASAADATTTIVRDITAPTITSFSTSTADGRYKAGTQIDITATASEAIRSGNSITVVLNTGSPGASVILTAASAGTTLTGTYTVATGHTSADLTVSSFSIVSVQDTAGNTMTSTTLPTGTNNIGGAKAIVIDTTAPAAPTTLNLATGSDTGTSSSDKITGDSTPNITLAALENTAAVTVAATDGTSTVDCSFTASATTGNCDLPTLTDGTWTITASQTDVAGNTSVTSASLSVIIDTTGPATPTSLTASAGSAQVTVSFAPGVGGPAPVTNYKYSLNGGAYTALSPADATSPITISGLTNDTAYSIRLKTVTAMGDSAESEAISATPSRIFNLGNVSYTEQDPAINVAPNVSFAGGTSYDGKYIDFAITGGKTTETLGFPTVSTAATTTDVVSIVGTSVYLGNGTTADPIGSVDTTRNGLNGQPLRINFTSSFSNSSFETGNINGWTYLDQQIDLGVTSIAGFRTVDTATYPGNCGASSTNDHAVTNVAATAFNYEIVTSTIGGNPGVTDGTRALRLWSTMTASPGGYIIHGPAIYSDIFSASQNDTIYFDWRAANGGDNYHVFGYILNTATGAQTELLDATGTSTSWATKATTIPTSGDYRFVFVSGTHDANCAGGAGASLYIDNVRVFGSKVNDEVASKVAQLITYANSSDAPDATRTITLSTNPTGGTTSKSLSVNITAVDDAPSLGATSTSYTNAQSTSETFTAKTGTLAGSDPDGDTLTYSLPNGTAGSATFNSLSYNQYELGTYGTLWIDTATGRYYHAPNNSAINDRLINDTETFAIRTTASGVDADSTFTLSILITAAAPAAPTGLTVEPGVRAASLSWTAPTWIGGSAVTGYKIDYSTNGSTWTNFSDNTSTATLIRVTGLADNTAYHFRVAAKNVNGAGTAVSTSPTTYTTFNIPTALALTPVGGTVVADTINTTNTNLTATVNITAGRVAGGTATLYLGTTALASDSSISLSDTSVSFDLETSTNAALRALLGSGGLLSVRIVDAFGVESLSSGTVSLATDYVQPTVSSVTVTSNAGTDNRYVAGNTITFRVNMSEVVNVSGTPTLSFQLGPDTKTASYTSGTGTSSLNFSYTVAAGDNDDDGISVADDSLTVAATLRDLAGNDAILTHTAVPASASHLVDTTPATISRLEITSSSGNDDTYKTNDAIALTATFTETVTVTGTPKVSITVGSSTKTADYVSGTGSNQLVFRYIVLAGDTDADGISISANSLTVVGASIVDLASNTATLTHSGLAADSSHKVDTTAPTVTLSAAATSTTSTSLTFTVTGSESLDCDSISSADFSITYGTFTTVDTAGWATSCTLIVTSTLEIGEKASTVVSKASSGFGITDIAGNAQTATLGGSGASTAVDRGTGATPLYPTATATNSSVTALLNDPTVIGAGWDIDDPDNVGWDTLKATVTTSNGTLNASAGDSGAVVTVASNTVTIVGSITQIEAVLNATGTGRVSLTHSSISNATLSVKVEPNATFTSNGVSYAFNATNGRYYRLDATTRAWTDASLSARGSSFAGAGGYLVVVTSSAEDTFVKNSVLAGAAGSVYTAGVKCAASITGKVCPGVTGAATGALYWSPGANAPDADSAAIPTTGTLWHTNEPNNLNTGSNIPYLTYWNNAGTWKWDDNTGTTPLASVVEFGNNATYSPLTLTRSVSYVIGSPDNLGLNRASVGTASGVTFTTQPKISVRDAANNVVVSENSSVITASVSTGATLGGTTTATAVNGIATFSDLSIAGTAGQTYTITYSVNGLVATTQSIVLSHGPAASLRIATQPVGDTAGALFATAPVIEILDANDNLVLNSSATVAVTVSGGQLGGAQSVAAVGGVATFSTLTFAGTADQNQTLSFTSTQLVGTTSAAFSVSVGAPTNLVVTTLGSGAKYGMAFETQPVIEVRDAGNNLVPTAALPVVASINSGSLVGTSSITSVNGVAIFGDLGALASPGTYTVTYTSGTLLTASQSITVARAPRTIAFTTPVSVTKTYGDATFNVSATASLGTTDGAVTYSASGTACSVGSSTGTVTITAAGSCTITANAAQGTNYLTATTTSNVAITINRTPLVITASSHDLTYSDPTPTITPTYTGFVYNETATALTTPPTCTTPYTPTSTALVNLTTSCTTAASGNYDITYVEGEITVVKQPTTVNFSQSSLSQVFTGAPRAVVVTTSPADKNLVMRYVGQNGITHDSANPPVNAGTYTVTATIEETNYIGTATTTLTITRATQTPLTLINPSEIVFGSTLQLVTRGGDGSGALSYRVTSGACTVSQVGVLTAPSAGNCGVVANREASANFLAASSSTMTVVVRKAPQNVSFTSIVPSSPAPGSTYIPSATSSSGLTPVLSISAGENAVCTLANDVVRFVADGTCEIAASQSGDGNFAAATTVRQSIIVGRLNQTISFAQPAPVTLGDSSFTLDVSASSGLLVAFAVTSGTNVCSVAPSGTVTVVTAGTCDITASQSGDVTYAAASPVTRSLVVRAGLPGIPHLMAVGAGDSSLTVSFSAPPTDGGSPIVSYVITATDPSGSAFTKSDCDTTSFSCTIEGLVNGTEYRTTVAAITVAGAGSPSRSSDPLAPFIAPQGARDITGNRSDSMLVVSWDEPESLGGGTLVRYDVSVRPEGGDFTDPAPVTPQSVSSVSVRSVSGRMSHTFRNLRNGVSYDIRIVTITTRASSGAPANTAQGVALPMITPDSPRDLRLESTDGISAVATWATPLKDGGSPLTRYRIDTNIGSCALSSPLATSCRITGLDSGSSLTLTIRTVTALGNSDPETATLSLPEKPGAPRLNEVTRAGTNADVAWSAPASTGGRPITSYRAIATSTLDPNDVQRCSTTGTTCTIRNLTATSAYTFTVRAINSVGTSAPSAGITVGGTSAIPSVWGTPSLGAASARRVLALPPGPKAVRVSAAGSRNRTSVTAVAPTTNVMISHAIITVAGTKGRIIARIKVAVDKDDPTASVTIPYASSKVRIAVQFANDYGISKMSVKGMRMPKSVTNRNDAAANVVPGRPGPEVDAKRMGKAVYFLGASAQLDAADKTELRRIAALVKREGGLVWVTGYARRSPTTSSAFIAKVSEQRAIAVAHYLATLGIQQWIRFHGAGAPTTTTGVDTDRRVDITLSPLD